MLAYVWLGATHTAAAGYGWSASPADSFRRAHELARKAAALDDKSASVQILLAVIYLFERAHDRAIAAGKLAIPRDTNFSIGHAHLAQIMFFCGTLRGSDCADRESHASQSVLPGFLSESFGQKLCI